MSKLRPKILLVDDISSNLLVLRILLEGLDVELLEVNSGVKSLHAAISHKNIALILLDVQMPEMNGYEVAELLKQEEQTKDIPIVFVSAINRDDDQVLKGYSVGAADYLTKPVVSEILLTKVSFFVDLWLLKAKLVEEIAKRTHIENKLSEITHYDQLTGLLNRNALREVFSDEINRATDSNNRLAVIIIDLDAFKNINLSLGQDAGDFTLVEVAQRVNKLMQPSDTFARTGNNEFILLMKDIEGEEKVELKVKQIIDKISEPMEYLGKTIKVCASFGLAVFPKEGLTLDKLLSNANYALQAAKKTGGGKLISYQEIQSNLDKNSHN